MNKGQSAIEYILLVTCIIAVLIAFLAPNGIMSRTIDSGINATVDQIALMTAGTNFESGVQHGHCGDGLCVPPETLVNCPQDCLPSTPVCGDGVCEFPPETIATCPQDCNSSSFNCPFKYTPAACNAELGCRWVVDCQESSGMCTQCSYGVCKPNSWQCPSGSTSSFDPCADCNQTACCGQNCYACQYSGGSFCGNYLCEWPPENPDNCPVDCQATPVCNNNGICEPPTETCANCPDDCCVDCSEGTQANCGISSGFENCYRFIMTEYQGFCVDNYKGCYVDGASTGYTTYCSGQTCRCVLQPSMCGTAYPDCEACNNNGVCESGETCTNCPDDCCPPPPVCNNNGVCESGETCANCPDDCCPPPPVCNNNGVCESGETCANCPDDCCPPDCASYTNPSACNAFSSCQWINLLSWNSVTSSCVQGANFCSSSSSCPSGYHPGGISNPCICSGINPGCCSGGNWTNQCLACTQN